MKRSEIEVRCGKQRGALRVAMRSEKEEKMTSKQRAYLKSLAMKMEPIMQIGKATITPELTESVEQALEARELIKINVLKNCVAMPGDVAALLAERTHSDVVHSVLQHPPHQRVILFRIADIHAAAKHGKRLSLSAQCPLVRRRVDSTRQSADHRHAVCRQHLREKGRLALSVRRTHPRAHNRRCFLLIHRQRAPHEKAGRHVRERHKPLRIALLPAADCKDFHRHTSDPPYTFVGAPKADRLADMRHADFDRPVQIRNCPRGADNPVVGTRAEAQAAEGIL